MERHGHWIAGHFAEEMISPGSEAGAEEGLNIIEQYGAENEVVDPGADQVVGVDGISVATVVGGKNGLDQAVDIGSDFFDFTIVEGGKSAQEPFPIESLNFFLGQGAICGSGSGKETQISRVFDFFRVEKGFDGHRGLRSLTDRSLGEVVSLSGSNEVGDEVPWWARSSRGGRRGNQV